MVGGRITAPLGKRRIKRSERMFEPMKFLLFAALVSSACLIGPASAVNANARSLLDEECDSAKHFAHVSIRVSDLSPSFKAIDAFRVFAASLAMQNFSTNCAQVVNMSACVPNTNGASAFMAGTPSGSGCNFSDRTCSPKDYYDWDIRVLSAVCAGNCVEQKGLGFVFCAGNVPVDVQSYTRAQTMFCNSTCYQQQKYLDKCMEMIEPQLNRCFDLKMKFAMTDGVTYPVLMQSVLATVDRVKKEQSQSFNISLQSFKGGPSAPQRPFMMDLGRANSTIFWSAPSDNTTTAGSPAHFFDSDAPQLHVGMWDKCPSTCGIAWQTRTALCESQPGYLDRAVSCVDERDTQLYKICTSTEECGEFTWQVAPWMPCHKKCGGGFTTRSVRCIAVNGTIVHDKHCPRNKPASTSACNTGECKWYTWLVGKWTKCSAECDGGFSIRPIICVDHHNNTVDAKHCGAAPKNFTLCGTQKCGKCMNEDCMGHGACVKGACKCSDDYKGFHCEVPKSCPTFIVDRDLKCCESGVVDINGLCHTVPGRLDATGKFCPAAKALDACGVCGGPAKVVDSAGTCKAKAVDANGAPCNDGVVDECGVCGGLGTSCALVLSLNVTTDPRSEASEGQAFHRAIMPRLLALAGVAPADRTSSNILVADRGWKLQSTTSITTVVDALIYPPFIYSTNNSISVGSTQMRISQMLPWSFPYDGQRITIEAPLLINRRGVCGNGICEIGERPIMGSNMTTFNVTNDTLAKTEPFLPCPQDCLMPYRQCPNMFGHVCGGNGYCTGNGVCMCFVGYEGKDCSGCAPGFKFNGHQCVYDAIAQATVKKLLPKALEDMRRTPPPPNFYDQLPHLPDSGVSLDHTGPHTLTDTLARHHTTQTTTTSSNPSPTQAPIPVLRRHRPTRFQQFVAFIDKHMVEIIVSAAVLLIGLLFLIMFLVRRRQLLKMMNGGDDKPVVPPKKPSVWKCVFGSTEDAEDAENGESSTDQLIGEGSSKDNLVVVIDANKKIGPPSSLEKMEAALEKARLEEEIAAEEADRSPQIMAVQHVAMEERGAQLEHELHVLEPTRTYFTAEVESSGQSNLSNSSITRMLSQTSSFIAKQWKSQAHFLSLVRNPDNVQDYEEAQRQASWDMGISNRLWDMFMPPEMMDWREEAEKEKKLLEDMAVSAELHSREVNDSEKVDVDIDIQPSPAQEEHIALLPHEPVMSNPFMSPAEPVPDLPAAELVPDLPAPCSEITPADEPQAPVQHTASKPPSMYKSPLDLSASDLGSRPNSIIAPSESTRLLEKEPEMKEEEDDDNIKQAKDQHISAAGRLCKTTQRLFGRFSRSKKQTPGGNGEPNLETVPTCPKPAPQEETGHPSPEPPSTPTKPAVSQPGSPFTDKSDTPVPSPPRSSPFQDSIALGRRVVRQCSSNRSSTSTSPFPSDPAPPSTCASPGSPTAKTLTAASRALATHGSPSLLVRKRSSENLQGAASVEQQLVRLYSDDVEHLQNIQHDWSEDGYESPFKAKESAPKEQPIGVMYQESIELGQLVNEEITQQELRQSEDMSASSSSSGSQAWREELWRSSEKKRPATTVDLSVDVGGKFVAPTEETPRLPSAPLTHVPVAQVPQVPTQTVSPKASDAPSPEQLTPRSRADRDQVVSAAKELLARVGKPFKATFRKPPPGPSASSSIESALPVVNAADEAKQMQEVDQHPQENISSSRSLSPPRHEPTAVSPPPAPPTSPILAPMPVVAEPTSYSSVAAAYAVDAIRAMMHSTTSTVSSHTSHNSVTGLDSFCSTSTATTVGAPVRASNGSMDDDQQRVMGWLDAAEHGHHYEQSVAAAQARFIHRSQGGDELMSLADHDHLEAPPPSPADEYLAGLKSRTGGQDGLDLVERTPSAQILEAARQLLASVPREREGQSSGQSVEGASGRRTWQVPRVDVEQISHQPPSPRESASPQLDIHNPLWSESLVSPTLPTESGAQQVGASLPEWVSHPNTDSDDEVTSTNSAPRPAEREKQTNVSLSGWTYGNDSKADVPASSLTSAPTGFIYEEAVTDDAVSKPYVYNKAVPHPRDLIAAARKRAAEAAARERAQEESAEDESAEDAQSTEEGNEADSAKAAGQEPIPAPTSVAPAAAQVNTGAQVPIPVPAPVPFASATPVNTTAQVPIPDPAPAPAVSAASSLSDSHCVGSQVAQEARQLARNLEGEHGSPPIKHVRFESISSLAADVLDGHDGMEATSQLGGKPLPADQAFNIVAAQLVTSLNSTSIQALGQQQANEQLPRQQSAAGSSDRQDSTPLVDQPSDTTTSQPSSSYPLTPAPSLDAPTHTPNNTPASKVTAVKVPGQVKTSPSPAKSATKKPAARPTTPEKDNSGRLSPLKAARAAVKGVMGGASKSVKGSASGAVEAVVGRTGSGSSLVAGAKKLASTAAGSLVKPATTKASPGKGSYAFGSRVPTTSKSATASPDPSVGKLSAARLSPFQTSEAKLKTPERAAVAPGVTAVPVTADKSPSDPATMKSPRRLFGSVKSLKSTK